MTKFSLKNKVGRLLWQLVWVFFGRLSPTPFHRWRAWLLRAFGAKVGSGVHVYPGVKIWAPWNLEIGDGTGIGNGVTLYCQGRIILGRRAVISQGAHLCGGTHDYTRVDFPLVVGDIEVGDTAWVAAEAFVHPGIKIGEGAILGARGVAVKDLEPWAIYSGNPCKFIKKRIYEAD